jgi:hypothetical protein
MGLQMYKLAALSVTVYVMKNKKEMKLKLADDDNCHKSFAHQLIKLLLPKQPISNINKTVRLCPLTNGLCPAISLV